MTERPCRAHHNFSCKEIIVRRSTKSRQVDCDACAELGRQKRAADKSQWLSKDRADHKEQTRIYQQAYHQLHKKKAAAHQREHNKRHKSTQKQTPKRQAKKVNFTVSDLQHIRSPEQFERAVRDITKRRKTLSQPRKESGC